MTNFSGEPISSQPANTAGAVAEASAGYIARSACAGLNPVQGRVVCPQGYKQTEVGVIPEDWEVKSLGEYVEIFSGESPSKFEFSNVGIPYFKVEQLNNGSVYAELTPYFVKSSKVVLAGSVIFPKRGASILSNKIRVLKNDSFMDTNLMALSCHPELNELYLYNQLTYRGLDSVADTTSIPQINNKHIIPYVIPIPVKSEQTAIANALSDVDALISELEKLIAKKQAIKTATMQQLLTGRTRLPQFALREDGSKKGTKPSELGEIPEDWEISDLGSLKPFVTSGSRGWAEFYSEFGDSFVRITNMERRSIRLNTSDMKYVSISESSSEGKRTALENGDVLISITADIGICSYVDEVLEKPAYINQHIALVRFDLNVTDSKFIAYYLASEPVQRLFLGSSDQGAKAGMNLESVRRLKVVLPDKEEQTAIATILSDMDAELQALEQRLSKTRQIKQGMMQELLTGKTRLV